MLHNDGPWGIRMAIWEMSWNMKEEQKETVEAAVTDLILRTRHAFT